MEEKLIEILESVGEGIGVYEQGSFTDGEQYPDNFFTWWLDDTQSAEHYDNKENACIWYFTINSYSTNPLKCTEILLKAITLLKQNDWIVDGKGKGVGSDAKTHSGRTVEAIYIEKEDK